MSGQVVPKRFGLKYSPRPMIALEYQRSVPDSGLAILEVAVEELSPTTYDVDGVVDALQKKHPSHLGPDVVSIDQLGRLVSLLLDRGNANLPKEYPGATGPYAEKLSTSNSRGSSTAKPSVLPKTSDNFNSGGLEYASNVPTPAPTPDVRRLNRAPSDYDSEKSDSANSGTRGDVEDKKSDCESEVSDAGQPTAAIPNPLLAELRVPARKDDVSQEEGRSADSTEGRCVDTFGKSESAGKAEEEKELDLDDEQIDIAQTKSSAIAGLATPAGAGTFQLRIEPTSYREEEDSEIEEDVPEEVDIPEDVEEAFGEFDNQQNSKKEEVSEESKARSEGKLQVETKRILTENVGDHEEKTAVPSTDARAVAGAAIRKYTAEEDKDNENEETPPHRVSEDSKKAVGEEDTASTLLIGAKDTDENSDEQSEDRKTTVAAAELAGPETPSMPPPPPPSPAAIAPNESVNTLSTPSPLSPSRGISQPPLPGTGSTSTSSLAGMPLPPVGGARPRFGLLGSLPPVGGRALPSLALDGAAPDTEETKETGPGISDQVAANPLSSRVKGTSTSAAAYSTSGPDSLSVSTSRGLGGIGAEGSVDELARGKCDDDSVQKEGGEVAELRARLGLDGDEGPREEGGEEGADEDGSNPDSPQQHQGREEEEAGRRTRYELVDPATDGAREDAHGGDGAGPGAGVGGRGGDGYFGDSDEEDVIEEEVLEDGSIEDEEFSFEGSNDGGGAGGNGDGNDDYFS